MRLEESVRLWCKVGDQRYLEYTLIWLGVAAGHQGDYSVVRPSLAESLEECTGRFRRLGDKWQLGAALYYLGVAAWNEKDPAMAQSRLEESLAIFREVGDKWRIVTGLDRLANILACLSFGTFPSNFSDKT